MNYAIVAFVVIVLLILVLANGSLPDSFSNNQDQTLFVIFIVMVAGLGAFYALRSKS